MAETASKKQDTAGIAYAAAASKKQFPKPGRPEIAFVGRSNVGKSTLVNALSRRRNLARTSKTPGKTRMVFFFDVSPDYIFVDLPGYGFAKTSRNDFDALSRVTDDYFQAGRPIGLVLLLIDIRRGLGKLDLEMIDYLCHFDIEWAVVLTKADKVSRQAALKTEREVMETVEDYAGRYGRRAHLPLSVSAGLNPRDQRIQALENRIIEFAAQAAK
ncbi:MAG TPA: ribosome biogenesis GTP-binding protein YsxC [Clostridiaceae bacterium]|nr:ribosome biogenesis GTP-binding protein YsxC [Clostridiaceae bacterium]